MALSVGFSQYGENVGLGTVALTAGFLAVSIAALIIAAIIREKSKQVDNKYVNHLLPYLKKFDLWVGIIEGNIFFFGIYFLSEGNFQKGIILISLGTLTFITTTTLLELTSQSPEKTTTTA